MPETLIPPAAPAAPVAPAPAPAPAPTPSPAPAAPAAASPPAPKPARPAARPAARPSALPKIAPRQKVSAKKALGLADTTSKEIGAEIKKLRERIRGENRTVVELPPEMPEAPAAPVASAPAPVAAAPAAPVVVAPPAPAASAPPAPTAVPTKVKVGDKEYTPEELAEIIAKQNAPAAAPEAPEAPVAAQPARPAGPTKEEIAAREAQFLQETAAALPLSSLTEQQMDTFLAGGKSAVELFDSLRKQDVATAILHARKGIAQGLDPIIHELFNAVRPLVANHTDLRKYQIEQHFLAKHKDFGPHVGRARQVAEALVQQFPDRVNTMTDDQFVDEVARQTDLILSAEYRQWFPNNQGTWRNAGAASPAATAAPVAAAPAPVAAPVAPAPAPAPRPQAPAANAPLAAGGGVPDHWHKSVARTLRG